MLPHAQLRDLFANGPVLFLVDGDHPGHRGLPPSAAGNVILLQLAGPEDRDRMLRGEDPLRVPYAADGRDVTAGIARAAFVGFVGRGPAGEPRVGMRPDAPPCMGPAPMVALVQILSGLGLVPPQAIWSHPSDAAELDIALADAEPDKRVAVDRARERTGHVWLGLHTAVPGLQIAAAPNGTDRHDLLLDPMTTDLRMDEAGIWWTQAVADVPQPMHVPWQAIWAVRTFDQAQGWGWPADMPPSIQAQLEPLVDVWPRLSTLAGVAMPPVQPPPPVLALSAPVGLTPRQAVVHCRQHGGAIILIDRHAPGVQVPRGLEAQAIVAVALKFPGVAATIEDDGEGMTATMPDAEGKPGLLRAPWSAVLSASSLAGPIQATWNWAENATVALLGQMRHDRPGHAAITLNQPFGPRQAQGQPTLQVDYELQRNDLH